MIIAPTLISLRWLFYHLSPSQKWGVIPDSETSSTLEEKHTSPWPQPGTREQDKSNRRCLPLFTNVTVRHQQQLNRAGSYKNRLLKLKRWTLFTPGCFISVLSYSNNMWEAEVNPRVWDLCPVSPNVQCQETIQCPISTQLSLDVTRQAFFVSSVTYTTSLL